MNHIELYENWKSTNPVYYIDKDDISDIMTEIIDNFKCHEYETQYGDIEKIENSHIRIPDWGKDDRGYMVKKLGLVKRCVKATYTLEIPDDKLEKFEKCLKLAEWRFHSFLGQTNSTTLNRNNIIATVLNKPKIIYQLVFEFGDCALN